MQRLNELEGARGLLAVWVVLVHLISAVGFDTGALGLLKPLFTDHIRVKIFCAMSGLVICILLSRTGDSYVQYLTKRFFRLFPAYLLVLLLSVLLIDVTISALEHNPYGGKFNLFRLEIARQSSANASAHILAHLTMLHGVIPDSLLPFSAYAFVGQAWNLSYEWVFYVCAPLLFWVASKHRTLGIGIALLYVCAHFATRTFLKWPSGAQFTCWFVIGFLCYHIWLAFKSRGISHASSWACLIALVLYAASGDLAMGIWALIYVSILGSLHPGGGNLVCRLLKSKVLMFLGKLSYSIYLVHMIPLYLGMYLLNQGNHSHTAYVVYLTCWTMAASITASVLLHHYVEQPSIEFGKTLSESSRLTRLMQMRLVKQVS